MAYKRVIIAAVGVVVLFLVTGADAQVKWRPEVVIAYPLTFNAWKLAIFKGTFERVTGWTIKWLELNDAHKATTTLGAGESQMVVANSLDIANALSRDIDTKIIWTVQAQTRPGPHPSAVDSPAAGFG